MATVNTFNEWMKSQILRLADSWKTLKSKYLENKIQFFHLVKKFINYTLRAAGYIMVKNSFLVEVTFKDNV